LRQYNEVMKALDIYYGKSYDINKIKVIVLSSSDEIGQTAFDVSNYQNRVQTIRKIDNISNFQETMIVSYLSKQLNNAYDYTGLLGFPVKFISKFVYNFLDSKYYFCSELAYDACARAGVFIAEDQNPSPWDIEKYNAYEKIFNNT